MGIYLTIVFVGFCFFFIWLSLRIANFVIEKKDEKDAREQYIDEQLYKIDYLISKVDYLSEVVKKNGRKSKK